MAIFAAFPLRRRKSSTRSWACCRARPSAAAELAARHDHRLAGRAWTKRAKPARQLRHAIEIRHPSFLDPRFVALLRRHNVALVFADTVDWPYAEDVTADFLYLRLHGSEELYVSGYSDEALDEWAARIRYGPPAASPTTPS